MTQVVEKRRGFSMVELLVTLAILGLVMAGIFQLVQQGEQRAVAEEGKVDDFQQARDFVDQIFRDSRQIGYPNVRNFDTTASWSPALQNPLKNDSRVAAGLIKLTTTQLWLEGDVDGSGNVSVVSYTLNGNGNCATCLQRAQVLKVNGDPLSGQTNLASSAYTVDVQNVQNTTSIFSAYDSTGTAITLPIDITNNPTTIASVKTIQVQLSIASSTATDPLTGLKMEADMNGRVQILNCSMATTGQTGTCQ